MSFDREKFEATQFETISGTTFLGEGLIESLPENLPVESLSSVRHFSKLTNRCLFAFEFARIGEVEVTVADDPTTARDITQVLSRLEGHIPHPEPLGVFPVSDSSVSMFLTLKPGGKMLAGRLRGGNAQTVKRFSPGFARLIMRLHEQPYSELVMGTQFVPSYKTWLEYLRQQIESWRTQFENPNSLGAEVFAEATEYVERHKEVLEPVPMSLVNGYLSPTTLIVDPHGMVIPVDWFEIHVADPLFDLETLRDHCFRSQAEKNFSAAVSNAYLSQNRDSDPNHLHIRKTVSAIVKNMPRLLGEEELNHGRSLIVRTVRNLMSRSVSDANRLEFKHISDAEGTSGAV